MEKELIQRISSAMDSLLEDEAKARLESVLHQVFENYNITKRLTTKEQQDEDNLAMLNMFVSAKKVEGCSERSLKYYESTIKKMLTIVNKRLQEITTNDLRDYLCDVKETRNTSKVTIDNIRRIFSSFFSWLEEEDYIVKSPVVLTPAGERPSRTSTIRA